MDNVFFFLEKTGQGALSMTGGNLLLNLSDGKASHLKVELLFPVPSLPLRRLCCRESLAGWSTRAALPTSCRLSKLCSASLLSSEVSDATQLVRKGID
jgi:hypothetical protein